LDARSSRSLLQAVEALAKAGVHQPEYLEKARFSTLHILRIFLDEAHCDTVFEQMLTYANHLKLYSEQLGKHGQHLGNFPQAFTHLSLIR
jgi:GH15 family glucan-1,4-alpha-glucosidase